MFVGEGNELLTNPVLDSPALARRRRRANVLVPFSQLPPEEPLDMGRTLEDTTLKPVTSSQDI